MQPANRICDRCGGVVEVAVLPKRQADGTSIASVIGACRSCGATFTAAGVLGLDQPRASTG